MTKEQYQKREQQLKRNFRLFVIFLIAGACLISWKVYQVPKTYTVTLSREQWGEVLQGIDSTNKLLLESDLPTRKSVYASSKLSFLTQTIQMQVGQEIAEEQKAAADTSKRVTKKPK